MIDQKILLKEWEKDCEIDEMRIGDAALNQPKLHSKYLSLLNIAKNDLQKAELAYADIKKKRQQWYEGILSKHSMDALGWNYDPYDGCLVRTQKQKDFYKETDEVLIRAKNELEKAKNIIETIESMIDNIRWRSQTIRNIIDWKKFEAGM
jgi:hypothetical protein